MSALTSSHWIPDGSGQPLLEGVTVGSRLREVAAEVPDRVALVEGLPTPDRRQWTYAKLLDDAECCARLLLQYFEPGEHVAVWAHNLPEWVLLEYGASLAGLTLVTVNPSLQPAEVSYILGQSRAAGLFLVPEVRGNPLTAHIESIRADLPNLRHVLRLDLLDELVADNAGRDVALPAVGPDDPAQIQYTSGTTGFPKGVVLRHNSIVNNARLWVDRVEIPDGVGMLLPMPLFHTAGCVMGVLGALDRRAKLVLMPMFDPGVFLELVELERPWYAGGVPTMLLAALEHPDVSRRDLSSWKSAVAGGAQVPEALVRRVEDSFGVDFTIIYGQTECSPVITNGCPSDSAADKGLTVGKPLPHIEVRIVDPIALETVPIGTSGELWARGFPMLGYFDMPEATAKTLTADGWVRTGDLAVMDERGYCRIVGRLKDMIIRGGENLFPAEIEEVLYRHPAVAEATVVGLPDERWGEVVGAFIRPHDPAAPPTVAELRSHLRATLSPQKTPTRWYAVDGYPLTGSGKIQKFAIREAWEKGEHAGHELDE
jgi:acyl-CoA synthetase (AMP-forming)/AMP-acid ligase II